MLQGWWDGALRQQLDAEFAKQASSSERVEVVARRFLTGLRNLEVMSSLSATGRAACETSAWKWQAPGADNCDSGAAAGEPHVSFKITHCSRTV